MYLFTNLNNLYFEKTQPGNCTYFVATIVEFNVVDLLCSGDAVKETPIADTVKETLGDTEMTAVSRANTPDKWVDGTKVDSVV